MAAQEAALGTICTKCGSKGPPGGKFCFADGAPMRAAESAAEAEAAPAADKTENYHRSHWTPTLSGMARGWVPPPRTRYEPEPTPPAKDEPLPEPPKPPAEWPPKDALCSIIDRMKDPRSAVLEDGKVIAVDGRVLGWVNLETDEAGTDDGDFLGCVDPLSDDISKEVKDKDDDLAGYVDLDRARVRDGATGSTIAEVSNTGEISGHAGSYLGEFEFLQGTAYKHLKLIGLYLLIIDVAMTDEVEG